MQNASQLVQCKGFNLVFVSEDKYYLFKEGEWTEIPSMLSTIWEIFSDAIVKSLMKSGYLPKKNSHGMKIPKLDLIGESTLSNLAHTT